MPSLGQVMSARNGVSPSTASPAGKQAAWPRSEHGKPNSVALQTHERLYDASYDTSDSERFSSCSRAAFTKAALEGHVEGKATMSTRLLQTEAALASGGELPSDLRFKTGLRTEARPPRQFREGCGKAGPRCVTERMLLTSRDLQAHAAIFAEPPEERRGGGDDGRAPQRRFVTETMANHNTEALARHEALPTKLSTQQLQMSRGVTEAVSFFEADTGDHFLPESRRCLVRHDPAAVLEAREAGAGGAISGVERIRRSREAWR